MSTTQGIDAKAYLIGWLNALTGMYSADIAAIPDDQWTTTHGGCTRSASDLTADAIALLVWTTQALNGSATSDAESYMTEQIKGECATKAGATAKLGAASQAMGAALAAASDEALGKVVTPPWQMDAPLFMICHIAVSHLWYHDGQLNYIQCLLGDDKVHWMG